MSVGTCIYVVFRCIYIYIVSIYLSIYLDLDIYIYTYVCMYGASSKSTPAIF